MCACTQVRAQGCSEGKTENANFPVLRGQAGTGPPHVPLASIEVGDFTGGRSREGRTKEKLKMWVGEVQLFHAEAVQRCLCIQSPHIN